MIQLAKTFLHKTSIVKLSMAVLCATSAASAPALADEHFPTEHKGLTVEQLEVVPAESMERQVCLDGHILS